MKFKKSYLVDDLDLPRDAGSTFNGCTVLCDDIEGTSRWSIHYSLIFRLDTQPDGEAWLVHYSVGSTESQDEGPWDYEDEVGATLVRQVERVVKVWEPVKQ